LTKARFLRDPLNPRSEERVFATGDLGRYRPDGQVEILGRNDRQLKIRGFRIEPAEIEHALETHPLVRQSIVLLRPNRRGDALLAAYVVFRDSMAVSREEVFDFARERLPSHMVPQAVIPVAAIPLTPNGKVDVRLLPPVEEVRPELATTFVPPRNEVEQLIAEIWREELGLERVGVHDNFFDLGGHSLLAVKIHHRLRAKEQNNVALLDLFRFPTINALARHCGGESPEIPDVRSIRQRAESQAQALESRQQWMKALRKTAENGL
jgi:hypothetical protein